MTVFFRWENERNFWVEAKKNQCIKIGINFLDCAKFLRACFRLVSDIDFDLESSPSPSKSDASEPDDIGVHIINTKLLPQASTNVSLANISSNSSVAEDDELGDGLRTGPSSLLSHKGQQQTDSGPSSITTQVSQSSQLARTSSLPWIPGQVERRRRKLPEIPKNKKCKWFMGKVKCVEVKWIFNIEFNWERTQIIEENSI